MTRSAQCRYVRLETALQTGDAVEIRNARGSWLQLCHNLRLYEGAVAYEKRERGLLVEKSEIEKPAWLATAPRFTPPSGFPFFPGGRLFF
jgi:hypothetical protein